MTDRDIIGVVTGIPHSGTTYLSKILASNPDIMTGFECGILLDDLERFPKTLPWYAWMQESANHGHWGIAPERMGEICGADNYLAAYSLIKKYAGDIGSPRIKRCFSKANYLIDKTPEYIVQLDKAMGKVNLPFVVMQKEIHSQYLSFKKRGVSILRFARYYLTAIHSLRVARKKYGGRLLVIQHQDLVADREGVLERIYAFLGLPYYPQSSLEEFFRKTGFDPGRVNRRTIGLRSELQREKDVTQVTGTEAGILKTLAFMQDHLPAMVDLSARLLRGAMAVKRWLRT